MLLIFICSLKPPERLASQRNNLERFSWKFYSKVHKMCPTRSQVYRAALESPDLGAFKPRNSTTWNWSLSPGLKCLKSPESKWFKFFSEEMFVTFKIFNFVATLTLLNSIDQLQVGGQQTPGCRSLSSNQCPELAFVCLWGRPMSTP